MSGAEEKAQIEAYIGATGTGKGIAIGRRLAELRPARLLVWDPMNDYAAHAGQAVNLQAVAEACARAKAGPLKIRFVPGNQDLRAAFELMCKLAFAWGRCVFIAEELSDVTTPGWAPPAWKRLVSQGRHRGLHIMGAAQRPAMIDKTFLGNATRVRCSALGYPDDERAMALAMRVDVATIAALKADEDPLFLEFLEYDRRKRVLMRGCYTLKGGRIAEKRAPT